MEESKSSSTASTSFCPIACSINSLSLRSLSETYLKASVEFIKAAIATSLSSLSLSDAYCKAAPL